MEKVKYSEKQIRFILDNYIKNENLCVKETGHSLGRIKLMLQNIGATYGFLNFQMEIQCTQKLLMNIEKQIKFWVNQCRKSHSVLDLE